MNCKLIEVVCPYCRHVFKRKVDIGDPAALQAAVETCPLDDGGCDKDFVVEYKVSVTSVAHKIQKEEQKDEKK